MKKIKSIVKEDFVQKYMEEHFPGVEEYSVRQVNTLAAQYYKTHNPEIKKILMEANIKRVVSCAYNVYRLHPETELDELVSGGLLKLGPLIDRYRPDLAYPFNSYINSAITNEIHRVPVIIGNGFNITGTDYIDRRKVNEFVKNYKKEHGRKPDPIYISQKTGVKLKKVKEVLNHMDEVISLTDNDVIVHNSTSEVDKSLSREGLIELFKKRLTSKDSDMVLKYFGLDGNKPHSLESIGKIYGLSRERVRQKINSIFFRLRRKEGREEELRALLGVEDIIYQLPGNKEYDDLDMYEEYDEFTNEEQEEDEGRTR